MPKLEVDGCSLEYVLFGEEFIDRGDIPVVMINGMMGTKEDWFNLPLDLVKASKRTVLVFDNRGAGLSKGEIKNFSIPLFASDTIALIELLIKKGNGAFNKCNVLGCSMGGMIAQEVALQRPDLVHRLVLTCTTARPMKWELPKDYNELSFLKLNWDIKRAGDRTRACWKRAKRLKTTKARIEANKAKEDLLRVLDNMFRFNTTDEYASAHPEIIRKMSLESLTRKTRGSLAWAQLWAILWWSSRPEMIFTPTLVLHGDKDRVVAFEDGQELHRRLPNSVFITVTRMGHILWAEDPRSWWGRVDLPGRIADFLRQGGKL